MKVFSFKGLFERDIIIFVRNSINQKFYIKINLIEILRIPEYRLKELTLSVTKYLLIMGGCQTFLSGKYLRFPSSFTSFYMRITFRTKVLWLHPLKEEEQQKETSESYAKVNFLLYTKKLEYIFFYFRPI